LTPLLASFVFPSSDSHADCVLIVPFRHLLGVEEEGVDFATYQPSAFQRVHDEFPPCRCIISLQPRDGVSPVADGLPTHIPALVYEPQSADERYQFGYHWHKQ
jgi:hypothetical protein